MRPIHVLVFVAAVALATAQEFTTQSHNENLNSIDTKASVRLDPYIRKALLKALSELEESNEQITTADITDGTSTVSAELLRTNEDATETLPQSTDGIQIHSFVVNGQAAFSNNNNSNTTPTIRDNKISIISTTAGNVENHVTATLPTRTPLTDIFQSKPSEVNVQQVRSIISQKKTNNDNSITLMKPVPPTTTTTTTTTTTSTTPRPTHNDDGENIEEVNQRDVQVFQAPLVAAFTVQQDAQGLPKKVIPLFQQTNFVEPLPLIPAPIPKKTLNTILPLQPVRNPQNDFISQQIALQRQLEEKQRILEEQLRVLLYQQRQQEELLRKQQFFLQQKRLNSEPQPLQATQSVNNFQLQVPKPVEQTTFLNQNNGARPQNSQVSIQPSIPLVQTTTLTSQQQLPNREAVDFLLHLRNNQPEQFPLQKNHIPPGITNFLQPNPINNFNQLTHFNQIRPEDQFRQKQANRVFRQESGVGNFGVNNNQNFNRFNHFNQGFPNRFFSTNRQNQFNANNELTQLLAQNGLSARSHEDLNIVSKVLSLNHGIPLNNRLNFDSRRHVRPLL